jgi:hypothetical protein
MHVDLVAAQILAHTGQSLLYYNTIIVHFASKSTQLALRTRLAFAH